MIIEFSKLPVIILSTPRSGSTFLSHILNQQIDTSEKKIKLYIEPTYYNVYNLQQSLDYFSFSDDYILKVHAKDLLEQYPHKIIKRIKNKEIYVIKLVRNNFVEQIASVYLAMLRKKFFYLRTDIQQNQFSNIIPIDTNVIQKRINFLNEHIQSQNYFDPYIDKIIRYEDICGYENHKTFITPKPENYKQLLDVINVLLNKSI